MMNLVVWGYHMLQYWKTREIQCIRVTPLIREIFCWQETPTTLDGTLRIEPGGSCHCCFSRLVLNTFIYWYNKDAESTVCVLILSVNLYRETSTNSKN